MERAGIEVTVTSQQQLVACLRDHGYPRPNLHIAEYEQRISRLLSRKGYSRPHLSAVFLSGFGGLSIPVSWDCYVRDAVSDRDGTRPQERAREGVLFVERDPRSVVSMLSASTCRSRRSTTNVKSIDAEILFLDETHGMAGVRNCWESMWKTGRTVERFFSDVFGIIVTEFGHWQKHHDFRSTLSSRADLLLCDEALRVYRLGRWYGEAFVTRYSSLGDFLALAVVPLRCVDLEKSEAVADSIWSAEDIDKNLPVAERARKLTRLLRL